MNLERLYKIAYCKTKDNKGKIKKKMNHLESFLERKLKWTFIPLPFSQKHDIWINCKGN